MRLDGDTAVVGITTYATGAGDVVYVELPAPGATLTQGESFGVVESVKAASTCIRPLNGEVMEANGALADARAGQLRALRRRLDAQGQAGLRPPVDRLDPTPAADGDAARRCPLSGRRPGGARRRPAG